MFFEKGSLMRHRHKHRYQARRDDHLDETSVYGRRSRRGGRVFGHGGMRFVLLQLISRSPSHGYELIRTIEAQMGGSYSPSPGTVYPTLTMLEEEGYIKAEEVDTSGRKRYAITPIGQHFLEENHMIVNEIMARLQGGVDGAGFRAGRPPQVMRAIENFKLAMRMRLAEPLSMEQAKAFAAILDRAVQELEQI